MTRSFERRTVSFVVRLWVEPAQAQGELHWRGQIEHIGSGETANFQVPAALLEFLAAHLPLAATALVKPDSVIKT